MATPLDLIRDGVTSANWELVVSGYEAMTGVTLDVPTVRSSGQRQEEIEEAFERLGQSLGLLSAAPPEKRSVEPVTPQPWDEPDDDEPEMEDHLASIVSSCVDDEEDEIEIEDDEVADEVEIEEEDDEEMSGLMRQIAKIKLPPPPKPRPPAKRVKVHCDGCNKDFSVPPFLVPPVEDDGDQLPYTCDNCKRRRKK